MSTATLSSDRTYLKGRLSGEKRGTGESWVVHILIRRVANAINAALRESRAHEAS
jgi:hypothetical protein